jgi:hypothetical protein
MASASPLAARYLIARKSFDPAVRWYSHSRLNFLAPSVIVGGRVQDPV